MSVRRTALTALVDITDNGAYANLRLKEALNGLEERDAAWVNAAVYTALDNLIYIDYVLGAFVKGRQNPGIRGILRLGVCQLLFMRVPASAACNESVKLAKEIGKGALSGLVNGVMRNVARAAENGTLPALPEDVNERLSVKYSWPLYIVNEYVNEYGAEFTEAMLAYSGHGMTVRAQYPYTSEALVKWLDESGRGYERGKLVEDAFKLFGGMDVSNAEPFLSGKLAVQSESAMLACRALGLSGGERVLDACAAPGGKSAYIASLLKNDCAITAWDIHQHRVELMTNTFKRLNVTSAAAERRDASIYHDEFLATFDAVLVDAPCSGLGVTGKPDARYQKSDGIIMGLAELQHSILSACCRYIRPGGTLVYSTCTVSKRENGAQISAFLNEHKDFAADGEGLCAMLPEGVSKRVENGAVQLFPHIDGTEGFFIARLKRKV